MLRRRYAAHCKLDGFSWNVVSSCRLFTKSAPSCWWVSIYILKKKMEKGESKKRGGTKCHEPLCHSNNMKAPNLSFDKIPVKAGLREASMSLLGITKEPLRSHKICSLHFPGGKKLYGTLPTAFIPSTRHTEKCRDRGTETNCPVNINISSQHESETSGGQSLEESYSVLETKYKQCVL